MQSSERASLGCRRAGDAGWAGAEMPADDWFLDGLADGTVEFTD